MQTLYQKYKEITAKFEDIALLIIRVVLAYGFLNPALQKLGNPDNVAKFFDSVGIPFPVLNVYLAGITEMAGVILLVLGALTRVFSVPLIFVMLVAIFTVHIGNGFSAGDNGFEIPLYYMVMLLLLMSRGAGRYSVDNFTLDR